jgi:valyl-tRNA synthetase
MKALGLSGDFEKYYRTDSDEYRVMTQNTFLKLWNKGLVYSSNRPNNYCTDCGTTIADAEIIYEERNTKLIYMKFKIKESPDEIIIASTRPELLFACQCVMVNPNDKRYEKLIGKTVILPLFNREVKIIAHHSAKPEFGTGAVMVYMVIRMMCKYLESRLDEIVAINDNGLMTDNAGAYANLKINQARERIIEDGENLVYR